MSLTRTLLDLGKEGPFRASEATAQGVPRSYLGRGIERGLIERVGYGLYRLVSVEPSEMATVVEVARKAPRAVVCLLTALAYHELTSEVPHAVWIMVEGPRRAPRVDFVKTEVVRASGQAFTFGVEQIVLEGVPVKITDPAKTVADCFRYRRHVGMEVAYTALRDYLEAARRRRSPAYSVARLTAAARVDRVYSVIRPSLEALLV